MSVIIAPDQSAGCESYHTEIYPVLIFTFSKQALTFATVHNPMKDMNMIDSCQAHLSVQCLSKRQIHSPEVRLVL